MSAESPTLFSRKLRFAVVAHFESEMRRIAKETPKGTGGRRRLPQPKPLETEKYRDQVGAPRFEVRSPPDNWRLGFVTAEELEWINKQSQSSG